MAGRSMGLPAGVEFHRSAIRIRFIWNGERRTETLPYPQTAKGIKAAADLRAQVKSLIKHGVLDEQRYAELFPKSTYIDRAAEITFGEYAQSWLDCLEVVNDTRSNYKGLLNRYWMPKLATRPIKGISTLDLRRVVSGTAWKSSTVKRAAIAIAKRMFKQAVFDEAVDRSPAEAIQLPQKNRKAVEPFSVEEAEVLLEWMRSNLSRCNQIYTAFFEFAFFTGMRTGEIMALRWDEIDLEKKTAFICRIVVEKQVIERTKTKYTRTVMLNARALEALSKAREIAEDRATQKRRVSTSSPYVFQPSGSSPHMLSPDTPGAHFIQALKGTGIPARPQYNCRHTYATMCLMAGMNPAFIAGQLGHSVQVLLSTYAKWLNSANDWAEIEKLGLSENGTKMVPD